MHRYLLIGLFLLFISALHGQKSEGGRPYSDWIIGLKSEVSLPGVHLKELNIAKLMEEDLFHSGPIRYGVYTDTTINLKLSGKSDLVPEGRIWRLRISNDNAKSLQLHFDKFNVPAGAKLFLYNDSGGQIRGAFTDNNVRSDLEFVVADFEGNHIVVEYFEPDNAGFEGDVIIGSIGQAYKDVLAVESAPGFININCPIGAEAQLMKHAVCRITFETDRGQATCSGALINNAKNDGQPYFLTANHCISTSAEASSLTAYFNYETEGCEGSALSHLTLTGAKLMSTGQPSDFTLLLLDDIPTENYQPFYAGWDANDEAAQKVTGVHVPFGETKKLSIDYEPVISNPVRITWDDNSRSQIGSHWIANFDKGETSQGSSGSPLFNSDNQIVGQLHGGDDIQAFYGKFGNSFTYKRTGYQTMAHYLDPDSTGIKEIAGYIPSDNVPDAFFTTNFENVCNNTPITFKDYSVFGPYTRKWIISPVGYNFVDGTTDTSPNPVIEFLNNTVYDIRLDLSVDGNFQSSEHFDIISSDTLNISIESTTAEEICDCDFQSINLIALGAENYIWSLDASNDGDVSLADISGDSTSILRINDFKPNDDYIVQYKLIGTQSVCKDTLKGTFTLLVAPSNDEIENAILLSYGRSDYFTNMCATVEDGEPIPPFTSCISQNSWCNEYGNGQNIVENSVWFKFVAGSSDRVSISSTGFDNQIALYEADSFENILADNFILLGANDDRSSSNDEPMITSEIVEPGKTYWIQVDGSGGGTEDEFNITILALSGTPVNELISKNMLVYPQPSRDKVSVSHAEWTKEQAEVSIFNTSGICIRKETVTTTDDNRITLDVSAWGNGVYIMMINMNNKQYVARIVKN